MSLVIVEGPDGSGKTTLVNELVRRWRWVDVHHHGAYLGETAIAQHYLRSCYQGLVSSKKVTIMDRSWLAESIYGAVMRKGEDRVATFQRRMLNRVALGAGAVLIACTASAELCLEAWRARRGEEYPQEEEQLVNIWHGYDQLFSDIGETFPTFYYNRQHVTPQELADTVVPVVNEKKSGPTIGAPAGRHVTLLIGDKPSVGGDRVFPLPFVSLLRSGCSAWLTEQLEAWGVPETRLAWVNQDQLDGSELELEKYQQVIALGGAAAEWCEANGIDHRVTYHPQYWKRFHHDEGYPLKELL